MDKEILQVLTSMTTGEKVALATIIGTKGSTPRQKGVSFLVFADGRTVGTIGGGCGEAEVKKAALMAMDQGRMKIHQVDMTADIAADEGMVCGGMMDVVIEPVPDPEPFRLMAACQEKNETVYSCLVVQGDPGLLGKRAVYDAAGSYLGGTPVLDRLQPDWLLDEPQLVEAPNGNRLFIQPIVPPHTLLILGGGYIAQALAAMAAYLDFEIAVVDDRPDFANTRLFPRAQVICSSFAQALREYPITGSTYVVIVTRGHRYDAECLRQVITSPAAYIGLIGSRRRTRLLFDQLEEEGYAREDLNKVKTPIGLDIGGETPAEIAVSILAEIIWHRRKGKKINK
ncbi:MAG TPA: XdhC family protein [Clostridia bacterium]|nr:XdhC family protein [Clostridia bacterium]